MHAIRVHAVGGPEVLKYEEVAIPEVGEGQILVKNTVCGVNYIDTYLRTGLYPRPLPFTPGGDGAGVIHKVGAGNTFGFKEGDRVAYCSAPSGSYAEYSVVNSQLASLLPENVSDEVGSALMIQGLTAHYLVKGAYNLKKGDKVLVHAAAGGLGRLLVQACKILGAFVIGTTSSEEKKKIALEAGCDEVILYEQVDFVTETRRITEGKGVQVVYDGVGLKTFMKSLDVIAKRGWLVAFGNASGKPPLLDISLLTAKGSISVVRPTLSDYVLNREEFTERVNEVIGWVQSGAFKINVMPPFALQDANKAHEFLEGRQSTGKLVLKP